MEKYKDNLVQETFTIYQALSALNNLGSKTTLTLFVIDDDQRLIGTLTDGDIRRALLSGKGMNNTVAEIMQRNFRFLELNNIDLALVKKIRAEEIEIIPILDNKNRLVKVLDLNTTSSLLPIDAVIMAGGKGKRLGALTADTPKPLLKIGNKSILEHSLSCVAKFGISNIYLSVNHLANKIRDHCGDGSAYNLNLSYIEESEPLGTIGSITLVDKFVNDYVLVMNSDILTNINVEDMLFSLLKENADMVVASIPYKVKVPYATLELENNIVTSFKEKPTYTYYSNGGIYLMKKEIVELIPHNSIFNATDLMEKVVQEGKKLISFPILGYWLDIGRPEDFEKAQRDIEYLKL